MPSFGMRRKGPLGGQEGAPQGMGVLGRWKYRTLEQRGADAPVPQEHLDAVLAEIDGFTKEFPSSRALPRAKLDLMPASHPEFAATLREYVLTALKRSSTTLIADLKSFYPPRALSAQTGGRMPLPAGSAQEGKADVLDEVLKELLDGLNGSPAAVEGAPRGLSVTPAHQFLVLLWQGQHLDKWGCAEEAEVVLKTAVDHTSTSPDAHHALARALKHQGAMVAAAECVATAAALDADDRYVNTKHAEYLAMAGRHSESEVRDVIHKFVHGKG